MLRAIFGGTFDPIHQGHLTAAADLIKELGDVTVHLMPNAVPPHRPQPQANGQHRLAMIACAIEQYPQMRAESFELNQQGPSYTAKTLLAMRELYPDDTLAFVMGMDSLLSFDQWFEWQSILATAHLIVLPRPGYSLAEANSTINQLLQQRRVTHTTELNRYAHGRIYIANTTLTDVSSTAVRDALASGSDTEISAAVMAYIKRHQLYSSPL
ncbi:MULTISPECIES: nicotinate-nucleotide adenylyltransferase [unclassified Idiomarina]|mgnify:FL=1|jgi:nicotinate-nucleotide adenylyltransferase|uniref:nicotinate-nucleotide adenylyltransferase n=1 Tax=unclassified Idiomarina TaxID=2614829 RepID=UPI000C92C82C|nr:MULTISPECIES: nicotinate-nucleotide adenylyltransferase [unclassified Idiomarina]MAD54899.1 nicotinate-nucleotide adenylyltransferase [Idiomarinaceae bacterium]MEC7642924.1 nicotinate-nucleotide adenylyltransferase [Pseudomonadota bacterium]MEC9320097.1 nicotinate-nucleotide adenylyltransferase [Pseudomonadota bacterium]NQZ03755.1 nicotinate-nucleotide adenylyltransferase [Idiomarina sp.]|tara:strand:+ start:2555 stop:3190 length:636 start_codon:yes stop_codon:yes gene_type:complete